MSCCANWALPWMWQATGLLRWSARERHYDLILMDIQMPHLDGLQATRQIRALPGHAQTPIVAMSANAFAEGCAAALAAGMNDHLPKPVDPAQLARVLARLLPHTVDATGATPTPSVATSPPTLQNEAQMRAQLQGVAGFQLEQGLRSLGNNFAALVRLLQRMVVEHPHDAQKALQAWQGGDLAETQRILHTLQGLAGTAGLTGLQVAAQQAAARVQATPQGGVDADTHHALQDLDARLQQLVQSLHFVLDAAAEATSAAPAADADHLREGLRALRPCWPATTSMPAPPTPGCTPPCCSITRTAHRRWPRPSMGSTLCRRWRCSTPSSPQRTA